MKNLTLNLKSEYFDQIKSGEKETEYRLKNAYWRKRLFEKDGTPKQFDTVTFCKGYPKKGDQSRRITKRFKGWGIAQIQHPHFGDDLVQVYCIDARGEEVTL